MRFISCLALLVLTSCAQAPSSFSPGRGTLLPSVESILRPALYAASLGETLDGIAERNLDPRDRRTFDYLRSTMEPRILAAFARGISAPEAEAFAAWTQRSDVAPFLAMERKTGAPDYDAVKADFIVSNRFTIDRIEATDRYLKATGYVEYAKDFSLRAVLGAELQASGAAVSPETFQKKLGALDAEEGDFWREFSTNRLMETYYIAFAEASIEEIARFIEAIRAPEAQWYFQRLSPAMMEAYDAALLRSLQREV